MENQTEMRMKRCEVIREFFLLTETPITRQELWELTPKERLELAELCATELEVELDR